MGKACNGCCFLNHGEHEDGTCCQHHTKRIAPLVPRSIRDLAIERAEALRLPLSTWVGGALQTFLSRVEAPIDDGEPTVRLEVTLPLYLCEWIARRDSRYVARRLAAYFLVSE